VVAIIIFSTRANLYFYLFENQLFDNYQGQFLTNFWSKKQQFLQTIFMIFLIRAHALAIPLQCK